MERDHQRLVQSVEIEHTHTHTQIETIAASPPNVTLYNDKCCWQRFTMLFFLLIIATIDTFEKKGETTPHTQAQTLTDRCHSKKITTPPDKRVKRGV